MKKKLLFGLFLFFISFSFFINCSKKNTSYTRLEYEIKDTIITRESIERMIEVLKTRFELLDIPDVSIKETEKNTYIIDIPSTFFQEDLKYIILTKGLFEFKMLKDPKYSIEIMKRIDNILANNIIEETGSIESFTEQKDTSSRGLKEEEFKKQHPFFATALLNPQSNNGDAFVREDELRKLVLMLNRPDVQKVIPDSVEFVFSLKPIIDRVWQKFYTMNMVNRNPELSGNVIIEAEATIDQNSSSPIVNIEMNSDGATEWARITGANIGKRIAIMMDGVVFSAPVIRDKISSGNAQLSGFENKEEAKILEIILKSGALPLSVEIVSENIVKK